MTSLMLGPCARSIGRGGEREHTDIRSHLDGAKECITHDVHLRE